jgi:biotin transport system permease protein
VLTLYRPGTGWVHRAPAGPKALALLVVVLVLSLLPSDYTAAIACGVVVVLGYLGTGLGLRELARQILAVRWVVVITFVAQMLFLQTEPAVANTSRVLATLLIAALLVLTTRIGDLLDAVERALRPFARFGADPARVALMLAVAITTVPVLVRLAAGVREAQRVRGAGAGLTSFVIPFLVVSLKHADDLGEALTARGVR